MSKLFISLTFLVLASLQVNAGTYTVMPTSFSFGTATVGLRGSTASITVTNTGTATVTVQSLTLDSPQFQLTAGEFPRTITAGSQFSYSVTFVPTTTGTIHGTAQITIDNAPTSVTLTGTGVSTGAIAKVTPTSFSFTNQTVGSTSSPQTFTITNSGTTTLTVDSVTAQAPFIVTGFTKTVTVQPGGSATGTVSFFSGKVGSIKGSVTITYGEVLPNGISLSGTGKAAASLAVSTFPTLPLATKGASYMAVLNTAGATGQVLWNVAAGSTLPPGLSLSSTGVLTGVINSTATYAFSLQATDSHAPPRTATSALSLQVLAATGAFCNDIGWDVPGSSQLMVPMTDLGTGTYQGAEGGLYLNGSNVRPAVHDADGVAIAKLIQPLNASGSPDPNGKMVLLGIGISLMQYEMNAFQPMAAADPTTNSHLVIVNAGEPSATAASFSDVANGFWGTITSYLLPNAGVTANQVVAIIFEDIDQNPTGTFPADNAKLQGEVESIARNIHTLFPNSKLMYLVPRIYSGYSNSNTDPEPYAYEYGFATKNAILDQVNGLSTLNYKAANGPIVAPWMAWGAYDWANGMNPRSDGLVYTCQDMMSDGHHPSAKYGAPKIAAQWLNFFKTDTTATPWFLAPAK